MLTAEEKASKANKQEIKGTGMYFQINNRLLALEAQDVSTHGRIDHDHLIA